MNRWTTNAGYIVLWLIIISIAAGVVSYPSKGDRLLKAASSNDTNGVASLIAEGVPVDYKRKDGRTPLMRAAELGHLETARLLINFGAKKELRDNSGRTALAFAKEKGRLEVVNLLGK